LLGLLILASSMGALAYLLISGLWRLKIALAWRRRSAADRKRKSY
jgi:uncharacterized protein (DUF2062 family)